MREILSDPWIVGMAVFVLGALGLAIALLVTGGRRWHDLHHADRTELMCDHCIKRWRNSPDAPPIRVLGDPRP